MPTYPYTSGAGSLGKTIEQLRKSFPPTVNASYLQRFQIAPKNESYILSILRFLGLIDDSGARVSETTAHFYESDDKFQAGMEATLRAAYPTLFEEMGDDAFSAERDKLAGWFRGADKTTDVVGQRQAATFQTLAAYAGHGEMPVRRSRTSTTGTTPAKKATKKAAPKQEKKPTPLNGDTAGTGSTPEGKETGRREAGADLGVTVRIEVNLPAEGDAETYDAIFASIRKHLIS